MDFVYFSNSTGTQQSSWRRRFFQIKLTVIPKRYTADTGTATVCPTVEDGPKWKLAFRYPVSKFSSDFHEIL